MSNRPAVAPLKIIMVEDSPLIVARVAAIISEIHGVDFAGHAPTVELALKLLDDQKPDAIILDINLRAVDGRNGIDLLHLVRRLYQRMVVVMLTNLTDSRYRVLCQKGGADFFLDKSNDFEKIPETIAKIIRIKNVMKT
jgi:DNA-binding NarL/FixJ family response regulator